MDVAQILIKCGLIVTDITFTKDKISRSKTGGLCIYFTTPTGDRPDINKLPLLKKRGGFESVGFKFYLNLAASVVDTFKICNTCYRLRDGKCTCVSSRARAGPSRADRRQAGSAAWAAIMNMQQESPN